MTDTQTKTNGEKIELVSFWVGGQEFGVDIMFVREIRGWTRETELPHAPDYVRGVINLRGVVLPIVNLAGRLGLEPTEPNSRHVIVVVQLADQAVGLLVDAVSNIFEVAKDDIQPTPAVDSGNISKFVRGLLAIEDRMISLIEIDDVLPITQKVAA